MLAVAVPFIIVPAYYLSIIFNDKRDEAVHGWAKENGYEIISSERRYRDRSLIGIFSEKYDLRVKGRVGQVTVEVGDPFWGYFSSRVILIK